MAESPEDRNVDSLIDKVQAALNDLKAAQRKDVQAEDAEEADEPKDLSGAEKKAQRLVRSARKSSE
jgi:hypothetical protein